METNRRSHSALKMMQVASSNAMSKGEPSAGSLARPKEFPHFTTNLEDPMVSFAHRFSI